MSSKRAFTLLEILVVIFLISILLGITIVRTSGVAVQRSMETAKGDLRAIQTAINSYFLHHSKTFPSGTDWLNNDLVNDNPRILRQVLYDPFRSPTAGCFGIINPSTAEYSYFTSSDGKYYVAFSYGPDRAADITGINTSGKLLGTNDDDLYVTNGAGSF